MKRGWRCDYCTTFNENEEEIKGHEESCDFNPVNKTCYTCRHRAVEWGFDYCCLDNDHFFGPEDKICKDWRE